MMVIQTKTIGWALAVLLGLACLAGARAQQILPNAQTQFTDSNGAPLASGSVTFYVPNTSTLKSTYSDSALSLLNPNPVTLDAAGRAVIWGNGQYREVLRDVNGNVIWDSQTAGFNNTFFASGVVSTGSAGSYSLAMPGAPGYAQGVAYSFRPNFTSVGGDTLNVNGLGAKRIYKLSGSGPVALSVGDIQSGFDVIVTYDSALNANAGGFAALATSGVSSISDDTNGCLAFSASSGAVLAKIAPSDCTVKPSVSSGDKMIIADSTGGNAVKSSLVTNGLALLRGYIGGCTLSNDSGTPNTVIDISACVVSDSTAQTLISLGAFTKLTSGAWVAGTGANGMGSGLTIANSTWYHVFAIVNGGSPDVYFDTSVTAANAPAGTTAFRRMGSFLTDGSAHIIAFTQVDETFYWATELQDFNGTPADTNAHLQLLTTPLGVQTRPILRMTYNTTGTIIVTSPSEQDAVPSVALNLAPGFDMNNGNGNINVSPYLYTNTAGQIRYRVGGTPSTLVIMNRGYVDSRGRFN